jgi:hypothetical protein
MPGFSSILLINRAKILQNADFGLLDRVWALIPLRHAARQPLSGSGFFR